MAFYKCIPLGKKKISFIIDGKFVDSYANTRNYISTEDVGNAIKFTPQPFGAWAGLRFSKVIPASAKKVTVRCGANFANNGYVGVSTNPSASDPSHCIRGTYIDALYYESYKTYTFDLTGINQPLYLFVGCPFDIYISFAEAE